MRLNVADVGSREEEPRDDYKTEFSELTSVYNTKLLENKK